jgi:hypothetical protein
MDNLLEENLVIGNLRLFGIGPACAKPRLQKPCGGQALRRRQVLGIWNLLYAIFDHKFCPGVDCNETTHPL